MLRESTGFDLLLGNTELKRQIQEMLLQKKIPHCILISGPSGSGKHTLARLLGAALQCTGAQPPCGSCSGCRKAMHGQHPDIITVDDPEHKTISVRQIRSVCADVYIRPNEGSRKIYLFPDAEKLTAIGQNTLLKILEEPPDYAVFLILASNPALLLPTVRSRCIELRLCPLPDALLQSALRARIPGRSEDDYALAAQSGYLGQALCLLAEPDWFDETQPLLQAFANRDALALLTILTPMEKWNRDTLLRAFMQWESLLMQALQHCYGMPCHNPVLRTIREKRTAGEIMQAIDYIRQAERNHQANGNAGAICGALAVQFAI